MALLNFDASQVQPDSGQLDPIPAGWYNAQVVESEIKPTKSNNGSGLLLVLKFKVLDGAHVGRVLFAQFNIRNENPTAQEIAYKQLSAVAHAVGVLQVQDSAQLHGIPLKVRVKISAATERYEARNEITAYKNINEQVQMAGGAPGIGAAQANPFAAQANPFAAQAGMPQMQSNPFSAPAVPVTPAAPVAPAFAAPQAVPGAIQGAPVQPWMQAAAQQAQAPTMTAPAAPVQQPPMQQAPAQQPAWAQASAPVAEQTAQAPQMQMSPPVDPAAVQQVQSSVPPWMKQPGA